MQTQYRRRWRKAKPGAMRASLRGVGVGGKVGDVEAVTKFKRQGFEVAVEAVAEALEGDKEVGVPGLEGGAEVLLEVGQQAQ